jgi:hypothetical protein
MCQTGSGHHEQTRPEEGCRLVPSMAHKEHTVVTARLRARHVRACWLSGFVRRSRLHPRGRKEKRLGLTDNVRATKEKMMIRGSVNLREELAYLNQQLSFHQRFRERSGQLSAGLASLCSAMQTNRVCCATCRASTCVRRGASSLDLLAIHARILVCDTWLRVPSVAIELYSPPSCC